jgi:hypothetical protein
MGGPDSVSGREAQEVSLRTIRVETPLRSWPFAHEDIFVVEALVVSIATVTSAGLLSRGDGVGAASQSVKNSF